MNIDRDRLMAVLRIAVILTGCISIALIHHKWANQIALIGGCTTALVYSIGVLLLSGKVERRYLYTFCALCDVLITVMLILSMKHMQHSFILLFMVLVLSLGIGRSLITSLLYAAVISAVYFFFYRYPSIPVKDHMLLWSNQAFTIGMIFIFSAGGALLTGGRKDTGEESRGTKTEGPTVRHLSGPLAGKSTVLQRDSYATQRIREGASSSQPVSARNRETINSLFSTLISLKGKNADEMYSVLASFIQSNTCAAGSALLIKENDSYVIKGMAGLHVHTAETTKYSTQDSFIKWLSEKNTPMLLNEKRNDPQMKYFKHLSDNIAEVILYPLHPGNELMGVLLAMTRKKGSAFSENDEDLFSIISGIYSFFIHNLRLDRELEQTNLNTIIAIAIFLEKRDQYTQGHSERVKDLSMKIARKMKLSKEMRERLERSAALHDIGKIGIPDAILNKPGRLDEHEFAKIQQHPEIGARMLEPLAFLKDSIPGILHHHEKFDGTGYPGRLKGGQIPLEAQIISVADVYDALTTNRPYRDAFSHDTALQMMKEMNGKNFDPEILNEFITMVPERVKPNKIEVNQ